MNIQAIVYPVFTGKDWLEPEPPIALEKDTKAAAIRALRERGYRIMWRGGLFDVLSTTTEELWASTAGAPDVIKRQRELACRLPDGTEITKYVISVWPK